jgi:hypothetical protein
MDAYIPQYKLPSLIKQSIDDKLKEYDFKLIRQSDNTCHYLNQYIEMNISYYHKEIGITFKSKEKVEHSIDIINELSNEKKIVYKSEDNFTDIEEYFRYLLRKDILIIEEYKPEIFYGK